MRTLPLNYTFLLSISIFYYYFSFPPPLWYPIKKSRKHCAHRPPFHKAPSFDHTEHGGTVSNHPQGKKLIKADENHANIIHEANAVKPLSASVTRGERKWIAIINKLIPLILLIKLYLYWTKSGTNSPAAKLFDWASNWSTVVRVGPARISVRSRDFRRIKNGNWKWKF